MRMSFGQGTPLGVPRHACQPGSTIQAQSY